MMPQLRHLIVAKNVHYLSDSKAMQSSNAILVENSLSGELVLSDFGQNNLRRYNVKC